VHGQQQVVGAGGTGLPAAAAPAPAPGGGHAGADRGAGSRGRDRGSRCLAGGQAAAAAAAGRGGGHRAAAEAAGPAAGVQEQAQAAGDHHARQPRRAPLARPRGGAGGRRVRVRRRVRAPPGPRRLRPGRVGRRRGRRRARRRRAAPRSVRAPLRDRDRAPAPGAARGVGARRAALRRAGPGRRRLRRGAPRRGRARHDLRCHLRQRRLRAPPAPRRPRRRRQARPLHRHLGGARSTAAAAIGNLPAATSGHGRRLRRPPLAAVPVGRRRVSNRCILRGVLGFLGPNID
jgi:hypothetical protein